MERRLTGRSVIDHFYDFLEQRGVAIPAPLRARDVTVPAVPKEEVQEGLYHAYKDQPDVAILLELMTDFDEGLQEWRCRQVRGRVTGFSRSLP